MPSKDIIKYGVSSWYSTLADHTFPTTFVKLREEEIELLAKGEKSGENIDNIIDRLSHAMKAFSGSRFFFADTVAPTDTERFKLKKGAVHSAESAWRILRKSEKIRQAAENREFDCICIRPFRNMTRAREFRLFVYNGELRMMSQYWLIRHFHRLEGKKEKYWEKAKDLINEISWLLPEKNIVVDIYFTASDEILLIDLNQWGDPTLPLLAHSWKKQWDQEFGLKIIPSQNGSTTDACMQF